MSKPEFLRALTGAIFATSISVLIVSATPTEGRVAALGLSHFGPLYLSMLPLPLSIQHIGERTRLHNRQIVFAAGEKRPSKDEQTDRTQQFAEIAALKQEVQKLISEGHYPEAKPILEHILKMQKNILDQNDLTIADTLNILGPEYLMQGQNAEAERALKEGLEIGEKNQKAAHSMSDTGTPDEETTHWSALTRTGRRVDAQSRIITSLNALIELYRIEGRNVEVQSLSSTRAKTLQDQLMLLKALAWLSMDPAAIENIFKEVLDGQAKLLGPNHPDVASTLFDLGYLYRRLFRYSESAKVLERALAIQKKSNGVNKRELAKTLNELGMVFEEQGRYTDAEVLTRTALDTIERNCSSPCTDIGILLSHLGTQYVDEGRYTEAEPVLKQALAIQEKSGVSETANLSKTLYNIALLHRAEGRYSDAVEDLKRILELKVDDTFGPAEWRLAEVYTAQGRQTDAEKLFRRSIEQWEVKEKSKGGVNVEDNPYLVARI